MIPRGVAYLACFDMITTAGAEDTSAVLPTVLVSKDGGAYVAATAVPAQVLSGGLGTGSWTILLTIAEMTAASVRIKATRTGDVPCPVVINTENTYTEEKAGFIDAAISDVPTVSEIRTEMDSNSTKLAGAALEATLTAIKGAGWSTETLAVLGALLDSIQAKTDNLPPSPAATGAAMTLTAGERTSIGTAVWGQIITGAITAQAALLAIYNQVIQFVFTTTGRVDASLPAPVTANSINDGYWSQNTTWDREPEQTDIIALAHSVMYDGDMSGWGAGVKIEMAPGSRLYRPATAADSLCEDLATGIAGLDIDADPVYPGFGDANGRGAAYWQVIPTGGEGVPWKTGELRDCNFQINKIIDMNRAMEALTSAELLLAQLNDMTKWALGGYMVEVCDAYGEPLMRAGVLPGTVIAGFNIRVVARKT